MAQETWHYLDNQFDNATEGSFKLMNILNADHLARLQAQAGDADIAALLARTTPPHDNYNTAYSSWLSAKAVYKGETNRVNALLNDLRDLKIKQWDVQIQMQFLEGTPDYIIILPNGKKPFYSGTMDDRISHLEALAGRLAAYPTLNATRTNVTAFHTALNAARDVQQQKEELVENTSDLLETARKNIALMMYRNLGALMDKYAANPQMISNFWELSLLRSHITDEDQTIIGKVVSTQGGAPLEGVKVTLLETGEFARTAPDGNYTLGTAHIGLANLEFVLAGYLSETFAIDVPEGGSVTQNLTMNPTA